MMIKAATLCQCGHGASCHTAGVFPCGGGVSLETVQGNHYKHCGKCAYTGKKCEGFRLTNLDLIEYLAEKRGLV